MKILGNLEVVESAQENTEGSVKHLRLPAGNSFPNNAKRDEVFYREDQDILYVYDDGVWKPVNDKNYNIDCGSY